MNSDKLVDEEVLKGEEMVSECVLLKQIGERGIPSRPHVIELEDGGDVSND